MISVDRPYERVKDLSRKDKSGYTDPDEYNRHLRDVQHILMSYYISVLEATQAIPENLNPFIGRAQQPVIEGVVTRPADMRYHLEVFAGHAVTEDCKTRIEYHQAHYAGGGEVGKRRASAIRRPGLTNPMFYFEDGTIRVEPEQISHVTIRYIKQPADAVYAYTVDNVNDRLVFDGVNSVPLRWLPQDEHNIVDLLLFMKGLETRDTALMQWAQGKRQLYGGVN
jgi:hypothetical protein